jgi:hypothetical protein
MVNYLDALIMKFWERLFGTTAEPQSPQPTVRLGRYTDSYKEKKQYDAWENALTRFEAEDYLAAYESFFKYLRDEREDNVRWLRTEGGYDFEILQGSKRVTGVANAQKFVAEARIVKAQNLSVAVMRRLVESNFNLEYSRYSLDEENNLVIKFDTSALDASPFKLYYALKELSVNADKQDDLLLDEFGALLTPIDMGSKMEFSGNEQSRKYEFILSKVNALFEEIESKKLDGEKYPGGISYLLLDKAYRIDYLTTPEGFIMETIERIHRNYFSTENKTMIQKNALILAEFEKIRNRSKELIFNELYGTTSTFGILQPKQHDALVALIDGELPNRDWYEQNGHPNVALAVPSYIIGHALFTYSLPKPDRELLSLYYKIFESDFFKSLNYTPQYLNAMTGVFDQKAIKTAIKAITDGHLDKFPRLAANLTILDFKSPSKFAASYLMMLRELDFTPKD